MSTLILDLHRAMVRVCLPNDCKQLDGLKRLRKHSKRFWGFFSWDNFWSTFNRTLIDKQFIMECLDVCIPQNIRDGCLHGLDQDRHNYILCDDEVISKALRKNGMDLECLSPVHRDSKELLLEIIPDCEHHAEYLLKYCSPRPADGSNQSPHGGRRQPRLQDDFDVCLAAVRKSGWAAIPFVGDALRGNLEIIVTAELHQLGLPTTDEIRTLPLSSVLDIMDHTSHRLSVLYFIIQLRLTDLIRPPISLSGDEVASPSGDDRRNGQTEPRTKQNPKEKHKYYRASCGYK